MLTLLTPAPRHAVLPAALPALPRRGRPRPCPPQLRPGGYANQTAPALQSDDNGRTVYVAVTAAGLVHHISVNYSPTPPTMELVRTLAVGGTPTAVVVAHVPAVVSGDDMA